VAIFNQTVHQRFIPNVMAAAWHLREEQDIGAMANTESEREAKYNRQYSHGDRI
jgi:hypothetical protein